jgi:hypothetical protein
MTSISSYLFCNPFRTDQEMPATDSPALIVARFLKANHYVEVCFLRCGAQTLS